MKKTLIICFACFQTGISLDLPGVSENMVFAELKKKGVSIEETYDILLGFRKSREFNDIFKTLEFGENYKEYKHK